MASKQEIIDICEHNFFAFCKLLNPHYAYGDIHEHACAFLAKPDAKDRQLILLPRGHLKSHIIACYAVWRITYRPWITIVYLSAGEDLAKDQIYAIKNMMTSDVYRRYWPEMLNADEGQREQWSAYSFNVDHPERKRRGIRDHTIIVKTVKSNAIGLHCDLLIPDDVVVPAFADTATGRSEVNRAMAQYTSILNPRGQIKAVGTRYHPEDLYQSFIDARYKIWDEEEGKFTGTDNLWEIFEEQVEDEGNGTGNFIWPISINPITGDSYGFDQQTLSIIRSDYESKGQFVQFFCQYYNDPNAVDTQRISRGNFQYYDRKFIRVAGNGTYYRDRKLAVAAAMDVAWTDSETSDFTAIAVIGVDQENDVYCLDLEQFKTASFAEYYEAVIRLHRKWGFRKIRVETNAGGHFVKQELERLVRQNGDALTIEGGAAVRNSGSKAERKAATLEWRYGEMKVWHYKGGLTSELEDQIVLERPRHDDLCDAFVSAISIAKAPGKRTHETKTLYETNVIYDRRFGGRRSRVA
jgi:phage terminase large subunit-like protein